MSRGRVSWPSSWIWGAWRRARQSECNSLLTENERETPQISLNTDTSEHEVCFSMQANKNWSSWTIKNLHCVILYCFWWGWLDMMFRALSCYKNFFKNYMKWANSDHKRTFTDLLLSAVMRPTLQGSPSVWRSPPPSWSAPERVTVFSFICKETLNWN